MLLLATLAGLLGGVVEAQGIEPGFMRVDRRLQPVLQMAPDCSDALDKESGKSVEDIANCVATCMDEVGAGQELRGAVVGRGEAGARDQAEHACVPCAIFSGGTRD